MWGSWSLWLMTVSNWGAVSHRRLHCKFCYGVKCWFANSVRQLQSGQLPKTSRSSQSTYCNQKVWGANILPNCQYSICGNLCSPIVEAFIQVGWTGGHPSLKKYINRPYREVPAKFQTPVDHVQFEIHPAGFDIPLAFYKCWYTPWALMKPDCGVACTLYFDKTCM